MKFIRRVLLIIFFVCVASLITLWAVTYFVQPKTFKLITKKQLSSLTHQDSAIDGSINWRIFPRPGLNLTKVRIGDVKKIDGDYALSIDNLLFNLQLAPLLHGQFVFDTIVFDGFTLHVNLGEKVPVNTTEKKPLAKKKTPNVPTNIALKSLLLTNGRIILSQNKQEKLLLKNVRLEAELPLKHHEPLPVQFKATLKKQSDELRINGILSYKGLLTLPILNTANTQLENLEIDGQTTFENIQINDYEITRANAHTFFSKGKLELNPLTLSLYNGESVGRLNYLINTHDLNFNQTGTGLSAEPVFQHVLDIRPSHLTGTLDFSIHTAAKINTPDWHKKMITNGNLTLHNGTLSYLNLPAITEETTKSILNLANENFTHIQQGLEQLKPWSLGQYSGSTAFHLLNLQYQAKGDSHLNYNLLLETAKLNLKGEGTLNLETSAIRAHLIAYLITKDKSIQAIQQLLGHGFPLKVTGTLSTPLIHADSHQLTDILSSQALPKALIKPLNKLKKHIKILNHAPITSPTE
ncbi:MAG: AsmA family protein [Gammaproteobacteria bacterium]|nr:AsmA family protein [Gammaproteobacteria bacterium]